MEHTISVTELPYPNGWFAVAFSSDLKPERMVRRRLMGQDIIVYRTKRGKVVAARPYCPHLGAHIGYGGTVEGDNVVCPFHRFAFAPSGRCVATGYGTTPPKIRLETSPARETNGVIMVWWHTGGDPPSWELPELRSAMFRHPVQMCTTLTACPQDMAENFVDTGHISVLHRYRDIKQTVRFEGVSSSSEVTAVRPMPIIRKHNVVYTNEGYGLGFNRISLTVPEFHSRAEAYFCYTPISPRVLEFRLAACGWFPAGGTAPRGTRGLCRVLSRLVTHALVPSLRSDLNADYPIWNNKVYVDRPRLAGGDGPIQRFRHWSEQFYSQPEEHLNRDAGTQDRIPSEL